MIGILVGLPQLSRETHRTDLYLFAATSVALERVEGLRIRLSAIDPHDGPVSEYESAEEELHDAEVDYNYCLYFPTDEEFQPPPVSAARGFNPKERDSRERRVRMWDVIERCMKEGTLRDLREEGRFAAWLKGAPPSSQSTTQVKSPENGKYHGPQATSESDAGVILNLEYETQGDLPSYIDDQNIEEPPAVRQGDEDLSAIDSGAASKSDTESNESDMDSESEDGDAMMQYSNSEQQLAAEAERNKKTFAVPPAHRARILADLNSHDLNAQLRYFHTTKAREEVDKNLPVRCLVCAEEGHMADLCESLTCSACGAFNKHVTRACPFNAKCGKCREQGHDEGRCPYKLKRMSRLEIVCDLCQRNGHIEEDCELIWRTSGRPSESNLAHANVRLSCYECGHSGHLGNDCSSRKPNKPMGTSTWDGNIGLVSIKSTQDFKIKGKATQQDPIDLDDSDDDRAKFFRPKISTREPVRKGQIRIVTGRHESPIYEPASNDRQAYTDHRRGSFAPVTGSYMNDEARYPYPQYRESERDEWRADDRSGYANGHNDYRPTERRSRSPPYREYGRYTGGSSLLPPRPADRRPSADANIYRPMPSAAQNAWTRRRL